MTKPRPPGRPPLDDDDPSIAISLSLPSKQLQAADTVARRDSRTLQDWIRRLIHREVTDQKINLK